MISLPEKKEVLIDYVFLARKEIKRLSKLIEKCYEKAASLGLNLDEKEKKR